MTADKRLSPIEEAAVLAVMRFAYGITHDTYLVETALRVICGHKQSWRPKVRSGVTRG